MVKKRKSKIDNLGFRRGMKVKVHPALISDPVSLRGKEVKILKVHNEVATVQRGKKKGLYMVDTLIKKTKGLGYLI